MGSRGASSGGGGGGGGGALGEGMQGSEKQVKWAKDILQNEMDSLDKDVFLHKLAMDPYSSSRRGTFGDRSFFAVDANKYNDAIEFMPKMRATIMDMSHNYSAGEIINNRSKINGRVENSWSQFKSLKQQSRKSGKSPDRKGEVILEYNASSKKVKKLQKMPDARKLMR